jgi:hypothetical protein
MRARVLAAALIAGAAAALIGAGGPASAAGSAGWRVVAGPPVRSGTYLATNLSCAASGFCLAVGSGGETASWSAGAWHAAPAIGRSVGYVAGLSCVTSSFCMAIGDSSTNKRTVDYTIAWTGSGWQQPTTLFTTRGQAGFYDTLHSVSCVSAHFCMTIGGGGSYLWNGASWSLHGGATTGTDGNGMVSCASSRFCANIHDNLPNYWNGSWWRWRLNEPLGNAIPRDDAFISQLSCVAATFCVAVDPVTTPLIWDGHTWLYSTVSVPKAALTTVSCTSAAFCVAASSTTGLALRWDGASWTTTAALGLEPGEKDPVSVACSATGSCLAVTAAGASAVARFR